MLALHFIALVWDFYAHSTFFVQVDVSEAKGGGSWRPGVAHSGWQGLTGNCQWPDGQALGPQRSPLQLGGCLGRIAKCRAPGRGCQTSAACPKQLSNKEEREQRTQGVPSSLRTEPILPF